MTKLNNDNQFSGAEKLSTALSSSGTFTLLRYKLVSCLLGHFTKHKIAVECSLSVD